ncbi:CrcB protein [Geomicrobium sp. JCM 19037]|uniref:fluoride efflux transporter CrcB n=1 Tax=Geomicrobium sp. JCM 19037 TaxID=1460634 RepID=UPI00045F3398|nr:fluoride efflux transporter CrcB [Geomicrobium sp. JCM 19037]GAK02653.1 CrcB protein [Geomicrobium sp. JCM 19037]
MTVFAVFFGGAAGAVLRLILGNAIQRQTPHTPVPLAMIIVNIVGSFGLGAWYAWSTTDESIVHALIAIGFFGGFTTFSTFSVEALELLEQRRYLPLLIYVSLTLLGSVVGFLIGLSLSIL